MSRFAPVSSPTLTPSADYPLGHSDSVDYEFKSGAGLTEHTVRQISAFKHEPSWMLNLRLSALAQFNHMPTPEWGGDLSPIDFAKIHYYLKPSQQSVGDWDKVDSRIKNTFDRIGVPQAEREILAGVKAQFDSEVIYSSLKSFLSKKGVIFLGMDEGLKQYPDLIRRYFGKLVPAGDNKLAALNTAVWSGGSFVYIPKNTRVDLPLQAYFRINSPNAGQFERTLIIAEEGSSVHYVEGCSAPAYSEGSLHAAVVEIFVKPGATVQYTTVQNWYKNVYNLVTKRARVEEEGHMRWVDGNLGSRLTMKYPSCFLMGRKATGETLSLALVGSGQHQDTGAKMYHLAPETSSQILAKSVSFAGGRTSYRGLIQINPAAAGSRSKVVCDALILDSSSRSDTYPTNRILNSQSTVEHEATVSRVGEDQLFYLMTRGLSEQQSETLIVNGFLSPIIKQIPLEYAVEMNRLVDLEMEGSVG